MNKAVVIVGLTAVVSFGLGYCVGGWPDAEPPSPAVTVLPDKDNHQSKPADPEPAEAGTAGASQPPADELPLVVETVAGAREVTPEFRASMEKGARDAHASFFLLYDVPAAEVDAIVRGMGEGQIEKIAYLEKITDLERKAPLGLGGSGFSDADRRAIAEMKAAYERESDAKARQRLGVYYDDFQKYLTTMKEHEVIARVAAGLDQRINSVTRDELLQILVEEELFGWQRKPASGSAEAPILEELTRDERLERHR